MSDSYTKWTEAEWASVAKRAAALRAAKPDMSWGLIAVVSQDEIEPSRRRAYFNKPSALKPLFDLLDLDDNGNPKPPPPPPPPPPPEPEPIPLPTPPPTISELPTLSDISTPYLVSELFRRGAVIKATLDSLTALEADLKAKQADMDAKLELALKRVDEVEAQVLQSMEAMDQINATYNDVKQLAENTAAKAEGRPISSPEMSKAPSRIAPMRVLLCGPFPKDIPRIREKLPNHARIEIILGENNEHTRLPANVHYALVTGHHDWERRWQLVRDHYGPSRARRLDNGANGTFANAIAELYEKLTTS